LQKKTSATYINICISRHLFASWHLDVLTQMAAIWTLMSMDLDINVRDCFITAGEVNIEALREERETSYNRLFD
jgi:hypothetical protein